MKKLLGIAAAISVILTIPVIAGFASSSISSGVLVNFHTLVGNTPGVTVRGVA
jgi:hypothetical protein